MTTSPPPRAAERLLRAAIRDAEWRDAVAGDLQEEFASIAARRSAAAARRWYWRQALALVLRFSAARLLRRPTLERAWVAPVDHDRGGGLTLGREFQHAWRSATHRPGMSTVVVVSLALALAANVAVFAILDAIVLRPFRFAHVDQLVLIASEPPQSEMLERQSVTPADFADWRREARTVTNLAAVRWWEPNLSGIDIPEQLPGFQVSSTFFDALGVEPIAGRLFLPDDETFGAHRRVVIAHALWHRLLGGAPDVVGRTMRLDGEPHEIVGVAPPGFGIPMNAQVWAPLAYDAEGWTDRRTQTLMVIGRLADGRTLGEARGEMASLVAQQAAAHPDTNEGRPLRVETFRDGMRDPGAGGFIGVTQAAALLLLVIACANIASLLVARGAERAQEYAMRVALGAGRARLAWLTMLEGVILGGIASALAVPLAFAGVGLTRAAFPASVVRFVPGFEHLQIDGGLLALLVAGGMVSAIVFSTAPALQASRASTADTLRHSGRSATASRAKHGLRTLLASAQVALTLALLAAAGLLLSAADGAINRDLGFDKHGVLVGTLLLPDNPYDDPVRRRQFVERALQEVATIPAAAAVATASNPPYGGVNISRRIWPEGVALRTNEARRVDYRRVSPDYFSTLRVPITSGRLRRT